MTVLVVTALVMIFVTILMSAVLVNFRMKSTNVKAQKNFYTAETALEEIRVGLSEELGAAAAAAYVDTVEKYSVLDGSERSDNYRQKFMDQMKDRIGYQASDGSYQVEHLKTFLKETKYQDAEGIGAQISPENHYANVGTDKITLKNVAVTYQDEAEYLTQIKTDLVLACPEMDFSENSEAPDITSYALIAGNSLKIADGRSCEVKGNAYIGENASVLSGAALKVSNSPEAMERGLLISGDMIKGEANARIDVSGMEVWAEKLVADSSRFTASDAAIYLRNDFVLSNSLLTSATASISGEFYGYGDLETAVSAVWEAGEAEEIRKNPADYSSSIIINGIRSSLDLSGLSAMKISGSSYINGTEYKNEYQAYGNMNTEDVRMGESLSIRSDQIAYLVPAECIAPDMESGGTNPMPVSQYSALLGELQRTYGAGADAHLVDLDCQTGKYQASLRELGVDGWQLEAQQVNGAGIGSMVYVFLRFDSTKSANAFFRSYYEKTDAARLGKLLNLYTDTGIRLPDEVLNGTADAGFYYNGNILASGASKLYVPDRFTEVSGNQGMWDALKAEEIKYQNQYAALNRKLTKDDTKLTGQEKTKKLYDNLVKNMVSGTDPDYTIGAGTRRYFVKKTGEAAVVVNGDFVIDAASLALLAETPDMEGNKHDDARLAVVIAAGDITVTQDFGGLLLAKGRITVTQNAKLSADKGAAGKALLAGNEDGIRVYDYLVGGEGYAISGDSEGLAPGSYTVARIRMLDYVTYENWSRQ